MLVFWFGTFLRISECYHNNLQHSDLPHQVNTSKVVLVRALSFFLLGSLKIMLVNFANKSLTGFFLLNIFTHISEGAVLLQFSVMCCRFPLFSETCKHGPACGLKNKTNMQTHTGSHTNTIRGYQRGLMCLAQLYHLLLSEAFCDEGIFQVANHYFLQAPGFSKDCYQVCACVLM